MATVRIAVTMLGTTYGHFAIRESAVLRAIGPGTNVSQAVFTMDLLGSTGLLVSVAARSCPEAQDRTRYPPIRGSFFVTSPLCIIRICLRFGETTLFDKFHDVRVEPGYEFITDWLLGTDALPERNGRD